ncbi:unnamed protein product [Symbiodinium sp. CCMP2592]|nr:unnamed protein product [Symbiodinium sp. CCMP2592]
MVQVLHIPRQNQAELADQVTVPTSCTVYWILFNSMAAYFLITWANRYARAGYVLAYTALQPFTSTVLTAALVVSGRFPSLSLPGWNALGGLGVVAGMLCILWDGKKQHEHDTARQEREVPLNQAHQTSVSLPEGGGTNDAATDAKSSFRGDRGWLQLLRSTRDETSTQCSTWRCYNNHSD